MDQIEFHRNSKKSPPEQFIAERVKSRKSKTERLKRHKAEGLKKAENRNRILTPNKPLTRLPALIAQIKANS